MKYFLIFFILPFLLLLFCGCESFKGTFARQNPKAPPLLTSQQPTLEQITSAINRNSMTIRNMTTETATVMVPGVLFPLRSRITFERPKRLRIQGGATTLTGQEFDFGSNDMLFWLWMRRLPDKEIYYCRHDQFPSCPIRTLFPIEPDWIIEAIGIVEFLPGEVHEGPIPTEDGHLMIITRRQTAAGQFMKRTVVDKKTGWVLRQEMYSPQNQLVALAISSDHRYDKGSGIHYARRVEVTCPGAEGKISIDLGTPSFNATVPLSSSMFTMPTIDGYRPVDICSPGALAGSSVMIPAAPTVPPAAQPISAAPVSPYPATVLPQNIQQPVTPQPIQSYPQPMTPEAWSTMPSTPEASVSTTIR